MSTQAYIDVWVRHDTFWIFSCQFPCRVACLVLAWEAGLRFSCVYAYLCICLCVCMHTYIDTQAGKATNQGQTKSVLPSVLVFYVCECICMFMFVYVCLFSGLHVWTYMNVYIYQHIYISTQIRRYVHTWPYACRCIYMCTHPWTHVVSSTVFYTYVHTYANACIHAQILR